MKRKPFTIMISVFLLLGTITPIIVAQQVTPQKSIDKNRGTVEIDSGYLIGIMYLEIVKCGWGWKQVLTPVFVLQITSEGRRILGPLSGTIEPYEIIGLLGPLYLLHSYSLTDGFCIICGNYFK
jgi:hypothetical protein